MDSQISFYLEPPVEVHIPFSSEKVQSWINYVLEQEFKQLGTINYVFCTDDYLLEINQNYLQHNTYTDIITFDNSEEEEWIEGDIFISIDRVRENAQIYEVPWLTELKRVMIHGVLHLIGFTDKTGDEQLKMRKKENECLLLWDELNVERSENDTI